MIRPLTPSYAIWKSLGAANRLPQNFMHLEIDWCKIIGLRNRIVHDYFNSGRNGMMLLHRDIRCNHPCDPLRRNQGLQLTTHESPESKWDEA